VGTADRRYIKKTKTDVQEREGGVLEVGWLEPGSLKKSTYEDNGHGQKSGGRRAVREKKRDSPGEKKRREEQDQR